MSTRKPKPTPPTPPTIADVRRVLTQYIEAIDSKCYTSIAELLDDVSDDIKYLVDATPGRRACE